MIPICRETVRADLAALAEKGRGPAEERLRAAAATDFFVPCRLCVGAGNYTKRGGARRPFDSRDFSAADGDVYVASCPGCRGSGRTRVSEARFLYLRGKALADARRTYRKIRSAVCEAEGMDAAKFDRVVRRSLHGSGDNRGPSAWLAAARRVASLYGNEA